MKKIIASPHAPKAVGPYSQAVEAGGALYVLSLIHIYMTLKSKALELEITPDAKGGGDALVVQGRGMSTVSYTHLARPTKPSSTSRPRRC